MRPRLQRRMISLGTGQGENSMIWTWGHTPKEKKELTVLSTAKINLVLKADGCEKFKIGTWSFSPL